MPERFRSIELAPQLVEAYAQTFIARWDRYPLQLPDGTYTQIVKPLTQTHVFLHLTALHVGMPPQTLGTYLLDEHSHAHKLCFDADTPEMWHALRGLADMLAREDIPSYLERSARGGHLWLFTPVLLGTDIRQFGHKLLAAHDIAVYDAAGRQRLELYPKQNTLTDGPGSFVRLPLGVHQKTGQIYPFITPDGQPLAPSIRSQIALLAHPQRVPLDFICAVSALEVELPTPPPKPTRQFRKRKARRGEPLSETLKHTISVFDFVSRYVELNHRSKGFCPFHDDQVRSFQVNVEHNYWHCYAGCGGGSIIDFWMKWRETHRQDGSFAATVKDLRTMLL